MGADTATKYNRLAKLPTVIVPRPDYDLTVLKHRMAAAVPPLKNEVYIAESHSQMEVSSTKARQAWTNQDHKELAKACGEHLATWLGFYPMPTRANSYPPGGRSKTLEYATVAETKSEYCDICDTRVASLAFECRSCNYGECRPCTSDDQAAGKHSCKILQEGDARNDWQPFLPECHANHLAIVLSGAYDTDDEDNDMVNPDPEWDSDFDVKACLSETKSSLSAREMEYFRRMNPDNDIRKLRKKLMNKPSRKKRTIRAKGRSPVNNVAQRCLQATTKTSTTTMYHWYPTMRYVQLLRFAKWSTTPEQRSSGT